MHPLNKPSNQANAPLRLHDHHGKAEDSHGEEHRVIREASCGPRPVRRDAQQQHKHEYEQAGSAQRDRGGDPHDR